MEHELPAIFIVLEQSAFAAAIRQSPLLYPLANVGHILALMIFARRAYLPPALALPYVRGAR